MKQFKDKIAARGARGFLGLQRLFKIIDDDNSKSLSRAEFLKCLKDFRLDFSTTESNRLFDGFDETHDGNIDYDEFLHIIRGEMNDKRINVLKQAFKKLDKTGDGVITIDDIRGTALTSSRPSQPT